MKPLLKKNLKYFISLPDISIEILLKFQADFKKWLNKSQ